MKVLHCQNGCKTLIICIFIETYHFIFISDSIWYKNVKDLQKFVNDEDKDYLSIYEKCIRSTPELWDSLLNLENKALGCWCEPSQPCHADVLIKLFNEKKNDEIQHQFGIETGKYGEYEICIDLTGEE